MSAPPYERVTYRPAGARRRTVLLGDVQVGGTMLTGVAVGKDGDTRWTAGGTTRNRHVIELFLVLAREPLTLLPRYGLLVDVNGDPL